MLEPAYDPQRVFGGDAGSRVRAFIAPRRYVQGPGVLDELSRYLAPAAGPRVALLISAGGIRRFGDRLRVDLRGAGFDVVEVVFEGESSIGEVDRVCAEIEAAGAADQLVAVGGGKCLDAGKMVAFRLGIPVAVVPTLASTDAPCSALSVVYSPGGVMEAVEFFPDSPSLVAVDSRVVAESPPRMLAAGMGDALATWYEARACQTNPAARSCIGARPTMTAGALGELCARTLYEHGPEALASARRREVTEALERVVEANTLLSGVGFESGGIAAAHCIASALTSIDAVRENFLHGEMVAIGLLAQLQLEGDEDEARRATVFCASVGLPAHLGQLGLDPADADALGTVADGAMAIDFVHNEPLTVTSDLLLEALLDAHRLGAEVAADVGDSTYRELHSGAG